MNATISRELRHLAEAMTVGVPHKFKQTYNTLKRMYKRGRLVSNGLSWEIKENHE